MKRWLIICPSLALFFGCGSPTIPSAVVEGTTATITLIGGADVGYGRAWSGQPIATLTPTDPANAPSFNSNNVDDEDLQRGEMILTLLDEEGDPITRLPVRFISRVEVDSATTKAAELGTTTKKQVVIVFDVPQGLVSDPDPDPGEGLDPILGWRDLSIRVERYRRNMSNSGTFELVPSLDVENSTYYDNIGWGRDFALITQTIPITVVDDPAEVTLEPSLGVADPSLNYVPGVRFTPREGWGVLASCPSGVCTASVRTTPYFESLDNDFVPLPEFHALTEASNGPAAWELEISFPKHRMSIVGVSLARTRPGEAYLQWSATESTTTCDTSAPAGTLSVMIVDPDVIARGVSVAFELKNQNVAACQNPIVEGSLPVTVVNAYDVNGVSIASPTMGVSF